MGIALDEVREKIPRKIDYVGFTFNGIHSSQLNILSVSNGSRYSMNLLPTIEDYSIDITGGIGSNYFGGTFKKREFSLNIAFDTVEELQLRAMQELFVDRNVHELYFDENPYKVYNAVISKAPNFTYLAFGNVGTRVYKGEGTIVFTCYDPIGYSKNGNYLDDYDDENISEWSFASGMLDNNKKYNSSTKQLEVYYDTPIQIESGYKIRAYNAGTLPTPFKLYIDWTDSETLAINNITIGKNLILKRNSSEIEPILIDTERSVILEMNYIIKSTMPTASEDYLNKVCLYTGTTTIDYTNNKFYKCIKIGNNYEWHLISSFVPEETTVVLNQLVEDGRFFSLEQNLN